MTRLVKIGNQVLPLKLRSVSVEDGEIVTTEPEFPMTYHAPVSFTFKYLNTVFVVRYLEIGNAARLKVTGNVARLPTVDRKADRNRVLALLDIIAEDVKNALTIMDDDQIKFYGEIDLETPISAERLMVGLVKVLAWQKPFLQLLQDQAATEAS
jgi:hypothetical protein